MKGRPKAGKPLKIEVSANEAATVIGNGKATGKPKKKKKRRALAASKKKLKVKYKTVSGETGPSGTVLKLKPKDKKAAKKLKKLVKKGGKATANVKLEFTDAAGNPSNQKLKVKLK